MLQKIITPVLITLLGIPVALAQEDGPSKETQLTLDDLRTFTDVFNQLRTNFVIEVDDHTLLNAAIQGMVSRLDPYSAFLDADQSRALEDSSRGRYGGVGVRLDLRNNRLLIDEVTPGGPADRAGLMPGDLITAVDGRPVRGRRVFESVDALTGEPGTEVKLSVKTGRRDSREVLLTTEFVPVSSVEGSLLEDRFAYFAISHFNRNSHVELEKGIKDILAGRVTPLGGIIIDLRGNPGGVVRPAVEIADGFLDEGLIVRTSGRYEATRLEFQATQGQWVPGIPLVLLVDERTASASEVLTGALKDHGRAFVIGERTFGKGSIQSIFNLRNGSGLKLTTAHYHTPSGLTIHENGILPDAVRETTHIGLLPEPAEDGLVREAILYLRETGSGES